MASGDPFTTRCTASKSLGQALQRSHFAPIPHGTKRQRATACRRAPCIATSVIDKSAMPQGGITACSSNLLFWVVSGGLWPPVGDCGAMPQGGITACLATPFPLPPAGFARSLLLRWFPSLLPSLPRPPRQLASSQLAKRVTWPVVPAASPASCLAPGLPCLFLLFRLPPLLPPLSHARVAWDVPTHPRPHRRSAVPPCNEP